MQGGELEGLGPAQSVEDWTGSFGQFWRTVDGQEQLLVVDPVLGELSGMVQPPWHGIGAGPGHCRCEFSWVLSEEHLDDLRTSPGQQVDGQPGAEAAAGMNPIVLNRVEPRVECRSCRGTEGRMTIALAAQQAEVVTDQMANQV